VSDLLKRALAEPGALVAPGIFDLISLRIAARSGFKALYMTGYGTVASHLGLPDAGLASFRDMVTRVATMADAAAEYDLPLIADGDTGYGGLLNVAHTIKGYEAAGAAAIQLEDQNFPKKCGHTPGRTVIPAEEMVDKIKVAVDTRRDANFLVIARTDARTLHGLDEAIRRMALYSEAGADILFVESPESPDELARIGRSFDKPLVANMVEGGRTPVLNAAELGDLGFKIALYPATGFLAVGAALTAAYSEMARRQGSAVDVPLHSFEDFNELMGFKDVWEFEKRHARR
jgi:2-methylisocitrate lyase-like PEP mutase family enzyme